MKKTLVLTVDAQQPDAEKIRVAAQFIRNGGLVAFPTETVYGLGANALDTQSVLALFEAKRRPLDNPPIVHVANEEDVYRLTKTIPNSAKKLMSVFWPGPLTLIFKRAEIVPSLTVAGLDTIAIRMPRHNVALALINESKCPIAAPSANLAGKPSPTSAQHVLDDLDGKIDAILDAGSVRIGVESTVLDLTVQPPQVLRPGGTSYEELVRVLGDVELNPSAISSVALPVEKARSPGVKHKHYAPRADMVLVEGASLSAIAEKASSLVAEFKMKGKRVGVLATDETACRYDADVVKSLGSRANLSEVALRLFGLLREFDGEHVDVIVAEAVPPEGLGLAVMNRLRKASGYRIVRA